jgi:hypothetical protein
VRRDHGHSCILPEVDLKAYCLITTAPWGTVDRTKAGAVSHVCEQQAQGCENLYEIAGQTVLKGGEVYALEGDMVTDGAHMAAVSRY